MYEEIDHDEFYDSWIEDRGYNKREKEKGNGEQDFYGNGDLDGSYRGRQDFSIRGKRNDFGRDVFRGLSYRKGFLSLGMGPTFRKKRGGKRWGK